jgi:uncharacterized membrane protein
MIVFIKLYLVALVVFFSIDLFWLGIIAKNLYVQEIGYIMADKVKWGPAILFYAIYISALVFFAVQPALQEGKWLSALLYGGFFGFVCYATYDLTNLATLKGWPLKIVVYDLLWGTFISGITSFATFLVGNLLKTS